MCGSVYYTILSRILSFMKITHHFLNVVLELNFPFRVVLSAWSIIKGGISVFTN